MLRRLSRRKKDGARRAHSLRGSAAQGRIRWANRSDARGRRITPAMSTVPAPSPLEDSARRRWRSRLSPLQELAQQFRLLLGTADVGATLREEPIERFLRRCAGDVACDPVVGGLEALPTGNLDVEAGLGPLRVTWRLAELVDLREQRVDEIGRTAITLGIIRPVESHQQHAGRDRI